MKSKKKKYRSNIRFLMKGILGYIAYMTIFPSRLSAYLHKWRGAKIKNPSKVYIAPNVLLDSLYPELITIGDGCYLTRGVKVISHFNPTEKISQIVGFETKTKEVVIKEGTFVGVNAIIMPGVVVGECAIVSAGAVVTKNVPDYAIVGGNPARVIGDIREKKEW